MRRHVLGRTRLRRAATLTALATVVTFAGATTAGVPSFADAAGAHITLDPAKVGESIAYLTKTYGISDGEALRRLQLQKDAQKLDETLQKERRSQYGGMWLDQDKGGVLMLAMTQQASADPYLAKLSDRRHVKTVHVQNSLAKLAEVRDRVAAKVGAGPDAIYLSALSVPENRVVLWEREWVAQEKGAGTWGTNSLAAKAWETELAGNTAPAKRSTSESLPKESAERQRLVSSEVDTARAAVASEQGVVVERKLAQPKPLYTPFVDWGYCHPLYCHPKYGGMRGGLRLDIQRDDGSWGGCTSGFNMRSQGSIWNGWAWVVTAGHCVVGKTNRTHIQHNGYDVLLPHGVERNSYPFDYAVLPYVDGYTSNAWLESQTNHNLVMTYCRNGGMDSDHDTPCGPQATANNTPIRGYYNFDQIRAGWVVCASGSGSHTNNYPDSWTSGSNSGYLVGTRCGKVTSTTVGINTDICARAGDSGGPLFSQIDFTAYGILEGSLQNRSGACYAGEENNYSPISTILFDLNDGYQQLRNNYNTTMSLITSSNG